MVWRLIAWGVGLILAVGLVVFGFWALTIWYMVKHSPKRDLFVCPRGHGMILPDHCIRFLGKPYCPYCYQENRRKVTAEAMVEGVRGDDSLSSWKLLK